MAEYKYMKVGAIWRLDVKNEQLIRFLLVIQKEKHFWKLSYYLRKFIWHESPVGGISCSQKVDMKPTVQSAKVVSDESDLQKRICSKKATHSSERAAARKE